MQWKLVSTPQSRHDAQQRKQLMVGSLVSLASIAHEIARQIVSFSLERSSAHALLHQETLDLIQRA